MSYKSLDEDFEEYDCESPLPYEELNRKTINETASEVKKEWLSELQKYEGYVKRYSSIRGSNSQNKAESFVKSSLSGRRLFELQLFVASMMSNDFTKCMKSTKS